MCLKQGLTRGGNLKGTTAWPVKVWSEDQAVTLYMVKAELLEPQSAQCGVSKRGYEAY